VTPPAASTPEGSNPQGGEQVLGQEQYRSCRCCGDDEIFPAHVRGVDQQIGQR
jgi:hypothetical protein